MDSPSGGLRERLLVDDDDDGAHENGSKMKRGAAAGPEGVEYLTVDEMLVKYVGEFGRAQFWHFVLVSLAWTVEALHTMSMIFGDRVPAWRCVDQGSSDGGGGGGSCTPSSSLCDLAPGSWEWVDGKSASTVSQFNLICGEEYKVGLAGSLFFIGALFGAGTYGSLSDSLLGRKGTLAMCCMLTVALGMLTSLVPNYWLYAAARFVTGLNSSGIGLCCFVLGTEIVGPNKRGTVGMSAFYFFSLGIMILPLFDMFTSSWRELYFTTSIPGALYCVVVLPFVWESPRWYLVKGRTADAMTVLRAFARRNGNAVPENVYLVAHSLDGAADGDEEARAGLDPASPLSVSTRPGGKEYRAGDSCAVVVSPRIAMRTDSGASILAGGAFPDEKRIGESPSEFGGTLLDIFRYGETRWRMVLMVCIWFFIGVCYYGISLNVVNLGFNLHVSVFLNGLVELPVYTLTALLLGRLGRKFMLVAALSAAGLCCLAGSFAFGNVPGNGSSADTNSLDLGRVFSGDGDGSDYSALLRLFCGIVGIFGTAGAYNLVYIYTMELFPTVVRNAALGLATQAGSIGSVVAPVVAVIGRSSPSLPFVVFGFLSIVGALLATRLPETKDQGLHETMEGMERTESVKIAAAAAAAASTGNGNGSAVQSS
ncbi:hypothetical protein MPTK2_8g15970 [Marchantia polymorpha subsp. ruderalis]